MNAVWVMYRRELRSYFSSPLAYILAGLFLLINGWIFFNLLIDFVANVQNLPDQMKVGASLVESVVLRFFGNINFILLLTTPLFTMRLLAEEKKQQTINLLYSAPISEWSIVAAKYLSAVSMVGFMLLLTAVFPGILYFAGLDDLNVVASGYLALTLNMFLFVGLGLVASGLTENQIVAAIIAFILILSSWLIGWAAQLTSNYLVMEILRYVGMSYHFEMLARGILNTSDITYYLAGIFMCFLISKKTLEARNW